jgi:hypothetical protein
MAQASVRAQEFMLGVLPEQRRQSRAQLPVAAKVFHAKDTTAPHIAYLRDINILGAFFYCDLDVSIGDQVLVELDPNLQTPSLNVNCEANVVRVEESGMNGMPGIAVEFHRFVVQEPSEPTYDPTPKPFVQWTVDMVEQKFARRRDLQLHADRIQGAA